MHNQLGGLGRQVLEKSQLTRTLLLLGNCKDIELASLKTGYFSWSHCKNLHMNTSFLPEKGELSWVLDVPLS